MKRKKTKKMKKKIKKTDFPDLVRLPKHSHFKHFFSSVFFKIKLLINKFFKDDGKNLELEIKMLKILLSQKELEFNLLKTQNEVELTVLKNEINQFNFQKIVDQK